MQEGHTSGLMQTQQGEAPAPNQIPPQQPGRRGYNITMDAQFAQEPNLKKAGFKKMKNPKRQEKGLETSHLFTFGTEAATGPI